jgi:hypothetical protein
MTTFNGRIPGRVFGIDSKKILRKWNTFGEDKHYSILLGVVVNPEDNLEFENQYDRILSGLFQKFNIEPKRAVYSSSDIAKIFGSDKDACQAFLLGFTRQIMALDKTKFTFFMTDINSKYLIDEKVIIHGRYGSATKPVSVSEFMNIIAEYYNEVCAWKVSSITGVSKATFILDGTDCIRECLAWEELKSNNYIKIVYNADKIIPVVSASDIIIKTLYNLIEVRRQRINEKTLEEMVHYDGKIPRDSNKFYYCYIGNPDINSIKPLSDHNFSPFDFKDYIMKPTIYVYAGGTYGQSVTLESSPIYDDILNAAAMQYAGVRIYDPKKDARIIGTGKEPDLFFPLNKPADDELEFLMRSKKNVKRFEL